MNKIRTGIGSESQKTGTLVEPLAEQEKIPDLPEATIDPIAELEKRVAILEKAVEQIRLSDIPRLNTLTNSNDKPVMIPEQKNHNPDRLPMGGEPRSYHQEQSKKG